VPAEVVAAHVELARSRAYYAELESEFVLATRSLLWTLARRKQNAAMLRRITAPVLLIHGDADRLVPVASARAAAVANPDWRYEEFADSGHVPQLEWPERTAATLLDWLGAQGADAAGRTVGVHRPSPDRTADAPAV
jgi:pimeloyl-ACP methyl ester carboxylesterase